MSDKWTEIFALLGLNIFLIIVFAGLNFAVYQITKPKEQEKSNRKYSVHHPSPAKKHLQS